MLILKESEKDFIYSLIFEEHEKFSEIISSNLLNFERMQTIINFNRLEHLFLDKFNSTFKKNNLPINFIEQIEKNYIKKAVPTLKIIEKIFLLSNKLQESNLEHVFLKGISLYDEKKNYLRPMRDIDILINSKDASHVVDLAKSLNFEFKNETIKELDSFIDNSSFYDLPLMTDDNGVFLEIHFRITTDNEKCLLKENIFKTKRLIEMHGNNLYVPSPSGLFTHLVYHASKKGNFNVGPTVLVDLLQLIDKVDKNEVLEISELLELRKITELFFELIESFKCKNSILSKDAEKLKEVLIFPLLNSKITEILTQISFLKMLSKSKDRIFVSKTHLQREFNINKSLPINFYYFKRWTIQINKYFPTLLFITKNIISVYKRNKTVKDLLKN